MSKELYSEIENLIIQWSNDGDKTAGHLTRQIMESLSNEKHNHVIVDLRNMDYMKDGDGKIMYYDTLGEACDVCGMYEFEDAWVMRLMYNHKEDKPYEIEDIFNDKKREKVKQVILQHKVLQGLSLVNPLHLQMTSNGHGEFPDGYKLTEKGIQYIIDQLNLKSYN
jgi:hypothetical protein